MNKLQRLKGILRKMRSILVAYSGGADSTFLLYMASKTLGSRVLAVTADSPTYPAQELSFARKMAKGLGVKHRIIKTLELKDSRFIANPTDRCYFCKSGLFRRLKGIAKKNRVDFVVDASNLSDKNDYRPGDRAKKEAGIRSPLQEARFTKEDIRKYSRLYGLSTWDKPSLACLASRIPYGIKISPGLLARINRGELYLKRIGFKQARLRHYNGTCRLEVLEKDIPRLLKKRQQIVDRLKKLGYNYITADLEGYRTGSMNEVIRRWTRLSALKG